MKKKTIIAVLIVFYLICANPVNAGDKIYTYETKLKFKTFIKDYLRGKPQITFRRNYKKLLKSNNENDKKILENIHKYRQLEMENAFKHAFVSAKLTYITGAKRTLKYGYMKELKTHDVEIRNFGGRIPAFLDTNCDLWNDAKGVEYALKGKKEHKSFKKTGKEIYDNLVHPNSDFIIDYKNDKRRWNDVTPDNLLEVLEIKYNEIRGK